MSAVYPSEQAAYDLRVDQYREGCFRDIDRTDVAEIRGLVEMLDCDEELAKVILLMNGPDDLETKKAAIWDALADIKARAVEEQVACCKRNGTI